MLTSIKSPNSATGGASGGTSQSLTYPTTATGGVSDYQPLTSTDAQGNTASISYDSNTHQATQVTHKNSSGTAIPGAESAKIQGDTAGDSCGAKNGEVCSTTDANGHTTSYAYDANGNVTTITPPAPLGARTFTYDAAGRVASATDGRGNTAYYTYDGDDRTTQVSYSASSCPAASCVSYVFDGAGNLTSRTSATETTSFGYDHLNRPTTKTQGGVLISTAAYDAASNLTSYTDASGTVGYHYDTANNLWTLAENNGSCPNYPTQPASPNSTGCTWFHYDGQDRRDQIHYPSGQSIVLAYDDASRITSVTAATAAGTLLTKRSYTYMTSGGNDQALLASMTADVGVSGASATQTNYAYTDGRNHLTAANTGPATTPFVASSSQSWVYDNVGNRTQAVNNGTTTYSAYNAADEICWTSTSATASTPCTSPPAGATTYGFDASGNQTGDALSGTAASNAFNVFNQVVSTNVTGIGTLATTYTETSNTERLSAGATSFLTGTLGMVSQTSSGSSMNFIRDPYGNLIALHNSTSGSHYYTTDAQGSVILLTDTAQNVAAKYTYDAWGNPTSATGTYATINPWRYAGGYLDPTGYTKLGARYYNPSTGRFTQPDPSHQETNNYTYARSSPANNTDPTGLFCQGFIECGGDGAVIGGFFGAIGGGAVGGIATGGIGIIHGALLGGGEGATLGVLVGGAIGITQDVVSWF